MGLNESGITGRNVQQSAELQMGLLLQPPESMTQEADMGGTDTAGDADFIAVKTSFGCPFIIECTIDTEETGGAATDVLTAVTAGESDVFPVFSSSATALTTGSPFKFKVVDCVCVLLDESAASAADTIMLQRVDQDGSTQTDITDAMSLNIADDLLVRPATLNQDACVIDIGENLRFDVVLANSSNHATCVKVFITCMRVVADE